MQVVGGAVQGVNDPLEFVAGVFAAFLAEDGVVRKLPAQFLDDGLFRLAVHFTDEVIAVLFVDPQAFGVFVVAQDDAAGTAGRAHGNVYHGMHGGGRIPEQAAAGKHRDECRQTLCLCRRKRRLSGKLTKLCCLIFESYWSKPPIPAISGRWPGP
jgi:hypothetical protein